MFDGVLDHRLQNQAGNLREKKIIGNINAVLQTLGEARFLNVEILLRELEFLSERDLLPVGILHDAAQEIAQPGDHADGSIVPIFANQPGDCVERIEQEMRLDLAAKRIQLRLRQLLVEACGFGLLKSQLLSRSQEVIGEENQTVKNDVRKQAIRRICAAKGQRKGSGPASRPTGSAILRTMTIHAAYTAPISAHAPRCAPHVEILRHCAGGYLRLSRSVKGVATSHGNHETRSVTNRRTQL